MSYRHPESIDDEDEDDDNGAMRPPLPDRGINGGP